MTKKTTTKKHGGVIGHNSTRYQKKNDWLLDLWCFKIKINGYIYFLKFSSNDANKLYNQIAELNFKSGVFTTDRNEREMWSRSRDHVQPLEPGLSELKGLEFLSELEISFRNPTMCESFSAFLPSKMTTSVK